MIDTQPKCTGWAEGSQGSSLTELTGDAEARLVQKAQHIVPAGAVDRQVQQRDARVSFQR